MTIELPQPIRTYFDAERSGGGEAVGQCFSENAVVKDEGHTHVGVDAIRRWLADSAAKYNSTSTPVSLAEQDGRTVVTSHVEGTFPGSPVDLRYAFRLDGAKIAGLEITL